MRDFEIAWLYPAEALSPCDGMVHRWDEHQHMMTTEGEAPVPRFPTAKGWGGGVVSMSGGCHIGLFDVESVKRNNNNNNIHYN